MTATTAAPAADELTARYGAGAPPAVMTGTQAIVRMLVEQSAADRRSGQQVATFVSGYQGSPLGTLDTTLLGLPDVLRDSAIHVAPGLNEELAATAVWGSQHVPAPASRTVDGVIGVWYGKAPGVDRAGDAFRHGMSSGVDPRGGVLVLAGDDPATKSSTLPCTSEQALAELNMPVLFPHDASEVIRLGMYGVALSRFSGLWVGMKITADVADGVFTVARNPVPEQFVLPEVLWDGKPWRYQPTYPSAPPVSLTGEAEIFGPRMAAARAFIAANPVNSQYGAHADARVGIVAGGKTHADVRQALADLGIRDEEDLERAGIRVLRLGAIHPLPQTQVRDFVHGLDTILVVEEKRPFLEDQLRVLLYGTAAAPAIHGKRDGDGGLLVPRDGELTASRLRPVLARYLARLEVPVQDRTEPVRISLPLLPVARTPYFCSGCPHNRSTVLPEGSIGGGGIGCHVMVAISPRQESKVTGVTQMGGEGAQWIGQAPFTSIPHTFQNIGDGTFFHSGQLAVQACVAAGVNITYKLLYNKAVAMTGGQDVVAGVTVAELTHKLAAEGVSRTIILTDELERYRRKTRRKLAPGVQVWHRDRIDEAQRVLRDVPGVTVLLYDQQCAAEARRKRKRGLEAPRTTRVHINEAVCEGCGDCGQKSNCLSVQPLDTEFGRKTTIDQTSCNTDYSCLNGDCPSFITVTVDPKRRTKAPAAKGPNHRPTPPRSPAPPTPRWNGTERNLFLAGIGGTGIVTVNQVLATAALRDGLTVRGLDQTGLSQKAGPVTSHLRILPPGAETDDGAATEATEATNRVSAGGADLLLGFDLLVAANDANLAHFSPTRTGAVISTTAVPTGSMVNNPEVTYPDPEGLVERVQSACRPGSVVSIDAAAATQALFGDTVTANLLLVGAAVQAGLLPISPESIEQAIAVNGVAVEVNRTAFAWGRAAVAHPEQFAAATSIAAATPVAESRHERATALGERLLAQSTLTGETARLAQLRSGDLALFQNERLARHYLAAVERIWQSERNVTDQTRLSEAAAFHLHKLLAYKDEYEVARLLLDPAAEARLRAEIPTAGRIRYQLHPPVLRSMGMDRKISLGRWFRPVLGTLHSMRRVRGTAFDPFGYASIRRTERELGRHYTAVLERLAADLTEDGYDQAVEIASSPDLVRGYESVKERNIARYVERLHELGVEPPHLDHLHLADAEKENR